MTILPTKDPVNVLGQPYLTKRKIQEVFVQMIEIYPTIEATERGVKILHSTYAKSDLDEIATATVQLDKTNAKY